MIDAVARIDSNRKGSNRAVGRAILALLLAVMAPGVATAATLITREEASLADTRIATGANRDHLRGPAIEQVSPAPGAIVTSPFHLVIRFTPRNEVPLDIGTATLVYAKAPLQDLTERVEDYMTAAGIDIPVVEAPPGEHWLRIRIRDKHLHWTTAWVKVTVARQGADAAATSTPAAAAAR